MNHKCGRAGRVLLVYDPDISPGIRTFQEALYKKLLQKGFHVTLGFFSETEFTQGKERVFRIPVPSWIVARRGLLSVFKLLVMDIMIGRKFDLVLYPSQHAPVLRSRSHRNIVVVQDVIPLFFGSFLKRVFYGHVLPRVIRGASEVVVTSEHSRSDLAQHYPSLAAPRLHLIRCGIDVPLHRESHDREPIILAIHRSEPWKNSEAVIQGYLQSGIRDHQLVLVGEDPKIANPPDGVMFRGRVSGEELDALYRRARFFVFLSLYEGFGYPIVEAQSRGCPVLASNCGAMAETAGEGALLVDPKDPADVAGGFRRLVDDEELREDLAAKGYENIHRFSWDKAADQYINLMSGCLPEQ